MAAAQTTFFRCWIGGRQQSFPPRRGSSLHLGFRCKSSLTAEVLCGQDLATPACQVLQPPGGAVYGVAVQSARGVSRGSSKPFNQDVSILQQLHAGSGCSPVTLIGVFDGHGPEGHEVAQMVSEQLAAAMQSSALAGPAPDCAVPWEESPPSMPSLGSATALNILAPSSPACLTEDLAKSWLEVAFKRTAEAAADCGSFMRVSGTTALVCLVLQDSVVAAWVGDSRAVLGEDLGDGTYEAMQVTRDHKPSRLSEAARILAAGGIVVKVPPADRRDGTGMYRVCLHPRQAKAAGFYGTGLSLSRAFGDHLLAPAGVLPLPDFAILQRLPSTHLGGGTGSEVGASRPGQVLIVASDGLWEVVGNEEAVSLAASAGSPEAAAQRLLDKAEEQWEQRHGGKHRDDITIAVAYL